MKVVDKGYRSTTKQSMADRFRRKAVQILAAQHRHKRTIAAMMKDWMDNEHEYVPGKKPDGIFHTVWEN